jgi:hypothetical protein
MPSLRRTLVALSVLFTLSSAAHAQQAAQPPAVTASNPADQQSAAISTKITNARVVEMTKLGLDDDIIIARIKHGVCDFQLSDRGSSQRKLRNMQQTGWNTNSN